MGIHCEDCKFADWEYRLFIDYIIPKTGVSHYFSEQFDIYCRKCNTFFLEDEMNYSCQMAKPGINNYSEICKCYYKQIHDYTKLLRQFRKTLERRKDSVLINSLEEYKLWVEYLKNHNLELYNKMQDND